MNQGEFAADRRRRGYQVFYGGLQAGMVNPDHAHDWDARVMVIGGEITIIRGGKAETFRVGTAAPLRLARCMPNMWVRKGSLILRDAALLQCEARLLNFSPDSSLGTGERLSKLGVMRATSTMIWPGSGPI